MDVIMLLFVVIAESVYYKLWEQ